VAEVIETCAEEIKDQFPDSSRFEGRWLFERATGKGVFNIHQTRWGQVPASLRDRYWGYIQRRLSAEPLQYILGTQPFMDIELRVGPGVFIPRAETEDILRRFAELFPASAPVKVLDLCAGSGAMGLGLSRLQKVREVLFVERSVAAISFLIRNVESHLDAVKTYARVVNAEASAFVRDSQETFDRIVCNPPYVGTNEREKLSPQVLREPPEALFAGPNGDTFYPLLEEYFQLRLKSGGVLLFEHHEAHQTQLLKTISEKWQGVARVEPIQDLALRPRGIAVQKASVH
jgi:release factor glutamine methyltransferase